MTGPRASSAIAQDLFDTLRGSDNLIFANERRNVEVYADLLTKMCGALRVPNEFFAHHGSLSKELREFVEAGSRTIRSRRMLSAPRHWKWESTSAKFGASPRSGLPLLWPPCANGWAVQVAVGTLLCCGSTSLKMR